MWSWERSGRLPVEEADAELGLVTLSGDPAGVLLGGERRWLPVYSPGGYCWRPAVGDRVLVLKAGQEGEIPCVLAAEQGQRELAPGEVCLQGGGSRVHLGQDRLELNGNITVNGQPLESYIKSVVSSALGGG